MQRSASPYQGHIHFPRSIGAHSLSSLHADARFDQTQRPELTLKRFDRIPGQDGRILPFIWRILEQFIGPAAAAHEGQQWPVMKPGETGFRDGAGAPSDDDACIAGKRHDQIPCVAHSTRYDDRRRPVPVRHVGARDDADNQATGCLGTLRRHTGRGTATATDQRDPQAGEQLSGVSGQIVCPGTRLRASQYANLRPTSATYHVHSHGWACNRGGRCGHETGASDVPDNGTESPRP